MSHGAAMQELRTELRHFARKYRAEGFRVEDGVCVAVSGGADSLALAAAASAVWEGVHALVIDHGLQTGSYEIAKEAARNSLALGCSSAVVHSVEVPSGSNTGGVEAAARGARYAALDRAREQRPVLLGHTLDDQAETVLLGMLRGSGTRSLSGMLSWRDPWARPILGVRRASTHQLCADLSIDPYRDKHNSDLKFARTRIRHQVLPLIEQAMTTDPAPRLARTAALAADDCSALDHIATAAINSARDAGSLAVTELIKHPRAIRTRAVRFWLLDAGAASPTYSQLSAIDALICQWRGQGPVAVGAGAADRGGAVRLVVARIRGKLILNTD